MKFIILVKEVPDLSYINDLSWDYEKSVFKRGKIPSCINPLDIKALAFAKDLSARYPGKTEITALSMGPLSSISSLVKFLSMGCSRAVLITDPLFAGSDTYATSLILSAGIRKTVKEIFKNNEQYIIISGAHSNDGDTAQVPPQIAQALDLPLIPYAYEISSENPPGILSSAFLSHRVTPLISIPCIITVSDYPHDVYPSLLKLRQSEINKSVLIWNSKVISSLSKDKTVNKSKTKVVKIYHEENTVKRKCRKLYSAEEIRNVIEKSYNEKKKAASEKIEHSLPESSEGKCSVWVYVEKNEKQIKHSSLQLIFKAKKTASEFGTGLCALTFGASENMLDYLISCGCDRVINNYPEPSGLNYDRIITKTVSELAEKQKPDIFLFPSTSSGRIIAARTAYSLGAGLTADCTSLSLKDFKSRGKILLQTRPALGGNITADIITREGFIQMASVRGGIFPESIPEKDRKGIIENLKIRCDYPEFPVLRDSRPSSDVLNEKCEIIISVGGGIFGRKELEKYIYPFAQSVKSLTGIYPQIAGSRKAVGKGIIAKSFQVGQTGKSVAPKIYIAVGISGAVQHLKGIKKSDIILSVNTDPEAQIISNSDYYFTGDFKKIIPELTNLFNEIRKEFYA